MDSERPKIPSAHVTPPTTTTTAATIPPVCRTSLTIVFWYGISNAIILSTKWLFTNHFPFPLTVTSYANGGASVCAAIVSFGGGHSREPLTRQLWWQYVLPIGVTTALEIGCSNLALKILTVSFGTILKGGGPIFTFLWGLLFGLEQFSLQVGVSLVLIAVGIALASLGEGTEIQWAGFALQLFASALGGLRWAMTHKLLKPGHAELQADSGAPAIKPMSALTATLYTCPMTSLCVLPFALALEGTAVWNGQDNDTNTTQHWSPITNNSTQPQSSSSGLVDGMDLSESAIILSTMTAIAALVFILLMSEYWLVKATSSLALSVAAVFKELLTIGGGIFFFSEHIDALNVVGFVTCQLGIMAYIGLRTGSSGAGDGEYAPITVEEATREALEAQREMMAEFPERFHDEGHEQIAKRFTIDDDDDDDGLL